MSTPPLLLASRSPRRRELLQSAGLTFEIAAPDVDEQVRRGEPARAYVLRLAREKALAVEVGPERSVLAADTTVVVDGRILGKPADAKEAAKMLRALSGRSHEVLTGVAARRGKIVRAKVERTRVWFRPLERAEIAWYVAQPEPYDKAGGYAIQGTAGAFVSKIAGSYSNVVGLPLTTALALLASVGHPMPWSAR